NGNANGAANAAHDRVTPTDMNGPAQTGQPNQTCGSASAPNTPGNAASAPGQRSTQTATPERTTPASNRKTPAPQRQYRNTIQRARINRTDLELVSGRAIGRFASPASRDTFAGRAKSLADRYRAGSASGREEGVVDGDAGGQQRHHQDRGKDKYAEWRD